MVNIQETKEGSNWVSLGDAARFLSVSQATARSWADGGAIRTYRTPGGHRRFSLKDLEAMVQGRGSNQTPDGQDDREWTLLRKMRKRLQSGSMSRQEWYRRIDEEGQTRMRLFGRRLVSLLARAPFDTRHRAQAQEEAKLLGREYGQEMASRGLSLTGCLQAFLFFRDALFESSQPSKALHALIDRVLLGIAEAYEKRQASAGRAVAYSNRGAE